MKPATVSSCCFDTPTLTQAPLLTNPEAFQDVRGLASIFNWSKFEVRSVVGMMHRWIPWSPKEVDWFDTWIGHDGDPPAPSSDF